MTAVKPTGELRKASAAEQGRIILDDGFGNRWVHCHLPECDLHIVRPGKVQCSKCIDGMGTKP